MEYNGTVTTIHAFTLLVQQPGVLVFDTYRICTTIYVHKRKILRGALVILYSTCMYGKDLVHKEPFHVSYHTMYVKEIFGSQRTLITGKFWYTRNPFLYHTIRSMNENELVHKKPFQVSYHTV